MKKLTKKEMLQIEGGGITPIVGFAIASIVSFVFGVISGYVHPIKCN